ncbi:protein phosphatase 2C domain-containing protein [Bradyrhizobium sp. Ai1a-2]|uniref:protein phosphatase 2C domain-containing protein n=1 Tax=Bradyrhizobium sp. Ai1a-2 TaxID=196490 RepID=UPI0004883505|nr:protein phosphatase 2C domain-containing protein [Bradyrhizobium sp. Ai1a-2]
MRFTADHAFHIGSQHLRGGLPCQDYALSQANGIFGAAVVSDGCSSGGRTDVGARIVAHSTLTSLIEAPELNERIVDHYSHRRDERARAALCLRPDDLLATCAYVAIWGNRATSRIVGDGVAAGIDRDGQLVMNRIEWANNMPVYRAYWRTDEYRGFVTAHGGMETRAFSQHIFAPDEDPRELIARHTVEDGLVGTSIDHDLRMFRFLAVFSDGVTQVDGMDWRDVVAELMSFKSTEGTFVKRRMLRFLKDCQQHGRGPIDDIAMACIHIDHEAV